MEKGNWGESWGASQAEGEVWAKAWGTEWDGGLERSCKDPTREGGQVESEAEGGGWPNRELVESEVDRQNFMSLAQC